MAFNPINIAGSLTTTTGTGTTLALGAALPGLIAIQSHPDISDGDEFSITIRDGGQTEVSRVQYQASGPNLINRTLVNSTTGSLLSLSGSAQVRVTFLEDDVLHRGNMAAAISAGKWDFDAMPDVAGSPIIQAGSNANGEFVRLADGTLLVQQGWQQEGDGSAGHFSYNWTYPATFSNKGNRRRQARSVMVWLSTAGQEWDSSSDSASATNSRYLVNWRARPPLSSPWHEMIELRWMFDAAILSGRYVDMRVAAMGRWS